MGDGQPNQGEDRGWGTGSRIKERIEDGGRAALVNSSYTSTQSFVYLLFVNFLC